MPSKDLLTGAGAVLGGGAGLLLGGPAGAALGVGLGGEISSLFGKDDDPFKDVPALGENELVRDFLNKEMARARDPKIFEKAVRKSASLAAPIIKQQQEAFAGYKDRPALYARLLEKGNQATAANFSKIFNNALLAEERAKQQASSNVLGVASDIAQSESDLAIMRANQLIKTREDIDSVLGDIFGASAELGAGELGFKSAINEG